jgi:hypothetical protein
MGLALVAAFAFSAVVAASASTPEYIYKVEGAKLEAGKTKEVTSIKAVGNIVLKGETFGVKATAECSTLKAASGGEPLLVGGQPGTSSKGKLELSACGAVVGGESCASAKIAPIQVNSEIVTVVTPAGKAGAVATLLTPTGTAFTLVKFISCGSLGNVELEIEGDTAALNSTGEAKAGTERFGAGVNEITMVKTFGGSEREVGLEFGGHRATLQGEAEMQLRGVKKWGVA